LVYAVCDNDENCDGDDGDMEEELYDSNRHSSNMLLDMVLTDIPKLVIKVRNQLIQIQYISI
jgi:hypothetical protein